MHKPLARSSRRVVFESLEPRILLSADLIGAESPFDFSDDSPAALHFDLPENAAPDGFTLRLNAESGDLELLDGANVVLSQSLAETTGVVINGEDGHDDWLTIDFAFGGVFSLPEGITFNGGQGGNDGLTVTGGSFTSISHSFTDTGPGLSGTMVYAGGSSAPVVIYYTDLEPTDMGGGPTTDLVFNLLDTNDQVILEDNAGSGISQIRSLNGAFETATFSSSATLTINLGGGNDSLTVASLPDYSGALTINGQGGTDSVTFTGAASFSTLSVNVGGMITDNAGVSLGVTGNAHFSGGPITLGDAPTETTNFGTLTINSTATAVVSEDSDMVLAGSGTANVFILTSSGSIADAAGASIRGMASTMTAGTNIGTAADALDIDLANLVARSTSGGIFVNDVDVAANGLRVHEITAALGTAAIEIASAGDIADGNGTLQNLFGSSVVLSAGRHIGFNGMVDALEINTGALTATSGTAAAAGDIYLSQQGNRALRLNTISADGGAGTIDILAGAPVADFLDGNGAVVNLQGGTVNLTAGRHIGFDGTTINALETEVTTLAAHAASGVPVLAGDIHINELGGSLALGLIDAEAGNITLASAASITDANGAGLNLRGSSVTLSAGQHIGFDGTTLEALETEVVSFGAIHSSGKVALSAAGALTLAGDVDVGANEVLLTAGDVMLASTAVLHVDIGGTAANQFTRYVISGALGLNGTLDAELVDSFEPAPGDRFRVMEFISSSGAFATTSLPEKFVVDPHASDLELVFSSNEPPVFVEIADQTVVEGGELSFVVDATDDPAQALIFTASSLPAGASFISATREFVWVPVDDAMATVTFTVTDPEGAPDTMEVVLTATNAAPTVDAGEDQVVGLQRTDDDKHDHHHKHGHGRPDADVSIAAAFDDLGIADTHVASIDWGDGTVTDGAVSEPAGAANGVVTGEHTYKKAGTYTVKVTVTDDDGGTRSDTLVVTVKKPVEKKNFDAREDRYKLNEDTVLRVDESNGVLANDRVPAGATLEARLVQGPEHGEMVLNADGSFVYVPDPDYHGKDSFWYEFTDGNNVSKAVEVVLQVKNVPETTAQPCIDWDGRWQAGPGQHDLVAFARDAWERFF